MLLHKKAARMAAVTARQEVPWNKIVPAVLAVVVIVAAFFYLSQKQ